MKKTTISPRLSDSNLASKKLGDIAAKKLEIKTEYYAKKLKIMEEQVSVLKKFGTLLSTFINSKDIQKYNKTKIICDLFSKN